MNEKLEKFYDSWSKKESEQIEYDVRISESKARRIISGIQNSIDLKDKKILDFGCGYGKTLSIFMEHFSLKEGYGFDFSNSAIEYATSKYSSESTKFYKLDQLDIKKSVKQMRSVIGEKKVDAILLIDLLEHIADCRKIIIKLAEITNFFIIKLPLEHSALDNYFLPKEYPSSKHSNGHLREFDVNNVRYFIRSLGLTPLIENTYIDLDGVFPPFEYPISFKARVFRVVIKSFKVLTSYMLPKKNFLKLIGGGGYYCLAEFDPNHILIP